MTFKFPILLFIRSFLQLLELRVGSIGSGIAQAYIKKISPTLFHNMNNHNYNKLEDGIKKLKYDFSLVILAYPCASKSGGDVTRTSSLHQKILICGFTNILKTSN